MPSRIYILSGGSGAGKTEALNLMLLDTPDTSVSLPKYSDRKNRNAEDDIVTVNTKEFNKEEFTFVYSMNNNIYGFKAIDIIEHLKNKKNVFIIVSDLRVIEEFKKHFGTLVSVIYIFRNMNEEELNEILEKRKRENTNSSSSDNIANDTESKIRKNRLYLIQRQYVENIALFDHVILNRNGKKEEMLTQLKNIVTSYSIDRKIAQIKGPVIFLIAAASGAGKRTLMHAMYTMGRRSIKVIEKYTNRQAQPDDGKEIIPSTPIELDETFDIKYQFNNNWYGLRSGDIWNNLARGYPQIVITNMDEFHQFSKIFGSAAIGVYLHATRTQEEILQLQAWKLGSKEKAEKKVEKMEIIHQGYIENISNFQHVLLNTIEKEDLWEQMFRLIKYYQG
jgi:guanylate kinase